MLYGSIGMHALEEGGSDTFLETTFQVDGNKITHQLKNVNEIGLPPKVWRYASFKSHGPFERKQAILLASFQKVNKMANDDQLLLESAKKKIYEFSNAGYPMRMIRKMCAWMGTKSGKGIWIWIRNNLCLA